MSTSSIFSDAIAEKFLAEEEPSPEELRAAIRRSVYERCKNVIFNKKGNNCAEVYSCFDGIGVQE